MGVSQNWGYLFEVPIIRIIVFWGLNWGSPISGKYHIVLRSWEGKKILSSVTPKICSTGSLLLLQLRDPTKTGSLC